MSWMHLPLSILSLSVVGFAGLAPAQQPDLRGFGIDAKNAPVPEACEPAATELPLRLKKGAAVAFVGNTLFDRAQWFGVFESMLHQAFPNHGLRVRTLAWSGDEVDLMPRPQNFGSLGQHLLRQRVDVVFAAFGFNESFAGATGLPAFRERLQRWVRRVKTRNFSGAGGAQIVLVSPIANEDVLRIPAGRQNNANIRRYVQVMKAVAAAESIGFADVFAPTQSAIDAAAKSKAKSLTFNGVHLRPAGYRVFAAALFRAVFASDPPVVNESLRAAIVDKNQQFHYRYRQVNSFYYVGGRKGPYGRNDFLPAMRRFDVMLRNRDRRIHALARGETVPPKVDDSNAPPMPKAQRSRRVNRWLSPAEERKAFKVDPRFEVSLFASEQQFPELACPIQMRWDAMGRLWVSCSTTYPHVYPGRAAQDKIIVLEDRDGDGRADHCETFAEGLHIPLSFEFGDGGLYVSEPPHLVHLMDTDGDGKCDQRRVILTGFGTEDSHHSLHDIAWTPDGDLIARDSIFLHSQVETPYGPVRLFDSGWFRFQPWDHRLQAFGMYRSTNPWGVTFDDWGQHVASHPIFASAFHATNPPYPQLQPRPHGLPAYSGTCGQEFLDMDSFPRELHGHFVKVRYKPTNRVELHAWVEKADHFEEKYLGDVLFSSNLSFIPVDIRSGPRGALYVLDWYNPVKGHSQYSLRDERRDRKSGRIWRITAKGQKLVTPPKIAGATLADLFRVLERKEYRYRYWAKREIRGRNRWAAKRALRTWQQGLDAADPRFRHHQTEALWMHRGLGSLDAALLSDLLTCEEHHARAAATRQLRYWHGEVKDAAKLLQRAAADKSGLVRLEAAVAASYIGTAWAFRQAWEIVGRPRSKHLSYALACSLNSAALRPHWEGGAKETEVAAFIAGVGRRPRPKNGARTAAAARFDKLPNLKALTVACVAEKMRFTVEKFEVQPNQPVRLAFRNGDATDHNLVICRPGTSLKVGMAAAAMARDPKNARSDFIPRAERSAIVAFTKMVGPNRKAKRDMLRFRAPKKPGVYPYICTFPGHFAIMKGEMIVKPGR